MRIRKLPYIALFVAAAAASIIAAPAASAASTDQNCNYVGGSLDTECQSPGNVQINDSAPVTFGPQYPYWEGGYFGGYGHGGRR